MQSNIGFRGQALKAMKIGVVEVTIETVSSRGSPRGHAGRPGSLSKPAGPLGYPRREMEVGMCPRVLLQTTRPNHRRLAADPGRSARDTSFGSPLTNEPSPARDANRAFNRASRSPCRGEYPCRAAPR